MPSASCQFPNKMRNKFVEVKGIFFWFKTNKVHPGIHGFFCTGLILWHRFFLWNWISYLKNVRHSSSKSQKNARLPLKEINEGLFCFLSHQSALHKIDLFLLKSFWEDRERTLHCYNWIVAYATSNKISMKKVHFYSVRSHEWMAVVVSVIPAKNGVVKKPQYAKQSGNTQIVSVWTSVIPLKGSHIGGQRPYIKFQNNENKFIINKRTINVFCQLFLTVFWDLQAMLATPEGVLVSLYFRKQGPRGWKPLKGAVLGKKALQRSYTETRKENRRKSVIPINALHSGKSIFLTVGPA